MMFKMFVSIMLFLIFINIADINSTISEVRYGRKI